MAINVTDVMSVYKKTGGLIDDGGAGASDSAPGGGSFADTLKGFAGDALTSLQAGENAAKTSVSGVKTDLASVATAISKAEIVLDEITTVRDKVISAYQAITSSAI
jgi:flagellar hook-basal body complex protein FliE